MTPAPRPLSALGGGEGQGEVGETPASQLSRFRIDRGGKPPPHPNPLRPQGRRGRS
jgi:hypothetical protein